MRRKEGRKRQKNSNCLGTCEKAAENGGSGGCFRRPFHLTLTRGPRRFRLLRQALTVSSLHVQAVSLLFFPPSSHKGPILGSSTSDPEIDFSRSLVGHGSRYMWDSVPICPSPSLPYSSPSLSLGVYPLSSPTRAFNHERNTIVISPCLSSSALDGFREPSKGRMMTLSSAQFGVV
jgi:hypothetical protein